MFYSLLGILVCTSIFHCPHFMTHYCTHNTVIKKDRERDRDRERERLHIILPPLQLLACGGGKLPVCTNPMLHHKPTASYYIKLQIQCYPQQTTTACKAFMLQLLSLLIVNCYPAILNLSWCFLRFKCTTRTHPSMEKFCMLLIAIIKIICCHQNQWAQCHSPLCMSAIPLLSPAMFTRMKDEACKMRCSEGNEA